MAKLWVGPVYGSPSVQRKAGVITLIHKNFLHTFLSHVNDSHGRESHTVILHGGEVIRLYNVYGPNGDNRTFFHNLGVKIQNIGPQAVILAGDLNIFPQVDRRGSNIRGSPGPPRTSDMVFPLFLTTTALRDGWRGRDYSFFSLVHQSWSRLDYALLSEQMYRRHVAS